VYACVCEPLRLYYVSQKKTRIEVYLCSVLAFHNTRKIYDLGSFLIYEIFINSIMKEKSEGLKRSKMTRYLFVQCSQSVHRPSLYVFSGSQAPYTHANGHMPSPGSPRPVTIKQAKRFLRFRLHVLASARLFAMASAATDISDEQILPSHPPIAS
jgi:hypothetical protein